jgi:broad specificity phosphatase PhoE
MERPSLGSFYFVISTTVFRKEDPAMTTRILVMRHAEKSDDPTDPELTPAGRHRAESLATYIPNQFGRPDFIFAASISKHSARPYETIKPLSKAIGVPIDATYAD